MQTDEAGERALTSSGFLFQCGLPLLWYECYIREAFYTSGYHPFARISPFLALERSTR
jgi:hypothetical protein